MSQTSYPSLPAPAFTPPFLPASLAQLIDTIRRQPCLTPAIACECVAEANVQQADLLFWSDFDHPITDSYGRKLVYDDGNFEIMVMSWLPGDFSAIHDHGATVWGAVQCFGQAEHSVYTLEGDRLQTQARMCFTPGAVVAVDHDLLHQMGNPGRSCFLSLHVYGCDRPHGSITGNARVFDLLEGSIQYTDGGVFFCLPEDKINHRCYGLAGDAETTVRHHLRMRDRLLRMLAAEVGDVAYLRLKLVRLEQQLAVLSPGSQGC